MLRLDRSAVPAPEILSSPEAREARRRISDYMRLDPGRKARLRAPVEHRLFLNEAVRDALALLCRQKCAFCEREVRQSDGYVHHFRPLENATGLAGDETREHYVWLAYDWENLLLACQTCAKVKGSLFPVDGARAAARATLEEVIAYERAELVDPAHDDPSEHLQFLANGACVDRDRIGRVTIATLSLNEPELVAARRRDLTELTARLAAAVRDGLSVDLESLFHRDREFIGARLDFLHRAISRWSTGRLPTARVSLPGWLGSRLAEATQDSRRLFSDILIRLGAEEEGHPMPHRLTVEDLAPAAGGAGAGARPPRIGFRSALPVREIATITIRNFKSLDQVNFELPVRRDADPGPPCLMLLGENAAGKSTVLEAVACALAGSRAVTALQLKPSEFVRRDDPEMWNVLDHTDPYVEVTFHDDGPPAILGADGIRRRFEGSEMPSVLVLAYGARRRFVPRGRPVARGAAERIATLMRPDMGIAPPEKWLRDLSLRPEVFDAVARALRIVLALDEDDELGVDQAGRMCVMTLGRPVPVERLSEGYRSLLAMTVDIMRNLLTFWPDLERARAVVLIDEIETHLHPRWKMRVMASLREALPGVQFIVTTHDPLCLRGMDDGEVEVLERAADGGVHQLGDLPSVRGMSAEQLLTSEYFGLWSTADPELEFEMARAVHVGASSPTKGDVALVSRLVLGDTVREQLIHEALDRYIASRRDRRDPETGRREAIDAILEVLRGSDDGTVEPRA